MKSSSWIERALLAAILSAGTSPAAFAQELIDQAFGSLANDEFGYGIAASGPDLDGDGFAEIAITSRRATSTSAGQVIIVSGRDLSTIQTIDGASPNDGINRSVAWCNDFDGDGIDDLAIGLPGFVPSGSTTPQGRVQIFSTATWTKLKTYGNGKWGSSFGASVARLADTDGDGVDELLIGAPWTIVGAGTRGVVYVYSGQSGGLIRSITLTGADGLGACVGDVGDVDGDGVHDVGAGAPDTSYVYPKAGAACVFSGADGSLLREWFGSSKPTYYFYTGDLFGSAIGAAGDFDGDGIADVWVASEWGISGPAYLRVFSGATGATLRTMLAGPEIITAIALGDVTGDGRTDFATSGFILGSSSSYPTAVEIFSSLDGKELWRGDYPPDSYSPGAIVAAAGDVDLDGLPDFLVGLPEDSTVAHAAGRVDRLASNRLWLDVSPDHEPTAGETLTLRAAEGPPTNPVGLFLTAVNGAPTFALVGLSAFDSAGLVQWSGKIPSGHAGTSLTLCAFAIDLNHRLIDTSNETIAIQ